MNFDWSIFDDLRKTSYMNKTKNKDILRESSLVKANITHEELIKPVQSPHHLTSSINRFKKTFKDDISLSEYQGSQKARLWKLLKENLSLIVICAVVFLLLLFFIYSPITMQRFRLFQNCILAFGGTFPLLRFLSDNWGMLAPKRYCTMCQYVIEIHINS